MPDGSANFPVLFNIPSKDRIASLARQDFTRINMLIIGALTMAFESMNLKRGMNEVQILDLSEAIIDSAEEDNLSLEDIVLFLQHLVRGKYEMSYESMDLPKFMKLFDHYRDERWKEGIRLRNDRHEQYKCMGDTGRTSQNNELAERFGSMCDRMHDLKAAMREIKKENEVLRKADKFFKG